MFDEYLTKMAIVASAADSVPIPSGREVRWQEALSNAVRDPLQLCSLLQLPREYHSAACRAAEQFPLIVPLEFIRRMQPGDPFDPLLRQVLPLQEELLEVPGYGLDPVGDTRATASPGLLQKYAGRALMVATPTCAVHCRYCFRRHYDYDAIPRSLSQWQTALAQLQQDPGIEEIILSGGDPLMLTDARIGELLGQLAAIPHLQRVRIHTRLPIVVPQRVTSEMVNLLRSHRLTPLMVIHANHPAELDSRVAASIGQLLDVGIPILNQSVLLRGVNDSVETLVELSRRLVNLRVMPYYLHQLDQVAGAAHFHVPLQRGLELVSHLRVQLPGYAVPRYVQEQAGHRHKTILA